LGFHLYARLERACRPDAGGTTAFRESITK
jgi:hypothetical protein